MGLLYPRLLPRRAAGMYEEYGRLTVAELTGRHAFAHPAAVYVATGGARASSEKLEELRGGIVDLAKDAGFPGDLDPRSRTAFDLRLGRILHTEMGMDPAEAASGDIWAFLALVLLPDVAYWRRPGQNKDNILGTDLTRHVFARMWWRAQLVCSPDDPDPYAALDVLGEAAFDQIYTRRKRLGASPHLVKAILRVWRDVDLEGLPERETLQDFLKRLLRLAPFVMFEALEDDALDAELGALAEESVLALRAAAAVTSTVTSLSDGGSDERPPGPQGLVNTAPGEAVSVSNEPGPPTTGGPAVESAEPRGGSPAPYRQYEGPGFGDPQELSLRERSDAIAAVVAAEGPVKALRVYRVIAHAAGAFLSGAAEGALISATKYAVRTGVIQAECPLGRNGYSGATLRLPDQQVCTLRDRGPRGLDEIPDRELAAAAAIVRSGAPGPTGAALAKETALLFGYERPTDRFSEDLADALEKYGN